MGKSEKQLSQALRLFEAKLKFSRGSYYVREINQRQKDYDHLKKKYELSEKKLQMSDSKAKRGEIEIKEWPAPLLDSIMTQNENDEEDEKKSSILMIQAASIMEESLNQD